jgi:plastocyanin
MTKQIRWQYEEVFSCDVQRMGVYRYSCILHQAVQEVHPANMDAGTASGKQFLCLKPDH